MNMALLTRPSPRCAVPVLAAATMLLSSQCSLSVLAAVIEHAVHAVLDVAEDLGINIKLAEHFRFALEERFGVIVAAHFLENGGAVARAAVGDGRAILRHLQRREFGERLADGALQRIALEPGDTGVLFLEALGGHLAGDLGQLDAGVLAETVELGVVRHLVDAELVAQNSRRSSCRSR